MTLTLLFDLDDTLLDSNFEVFIPAYFQALSESLDDYVSPDRMLPALLGGTNRMLENNEVNITLQHVFENYFYPKLGISKSELQPAIDLFYEERFSSLRNLTKPRPDAIKLVEWAFKQGYRVVIATNPLFPMTAITQRLDWAGLSPDKYRFDLVTAFESFHFAKPSPAYFAEILATLGWPVEPVLMVGNDLDNDIIPARKIGITSFWVLPDHEQPVVGVDPIACGTIEDVQPWLEKVNLQDLQISLVTPIALLSVLKANPAALITFLSSVDDEVWNKHPEVGEWNLTEIVCHLRDVEREVHLPRLRKIVDENNPFIAGQVTDPWAQERRYSEQNGRDALTEYVHARNHTLELLISLQPSIWQKAARHAFFGPTDLQEMVGFMVEHERSHFHQIWNIVRQIND